MGYLRFDCIVTSVYNPHFSNFSYTPKGCDYRQGGDQRPNLTRHHVLAVVARRREKPAGHLSSLTTLLRGAARRAAHVFGSFHGSPTTPYTRNTTLCTHTTRRPLLTASRHLRPTALTLSMLRHGPPSAAAAVFSFVAWPGDRVSTRRWGQTVLSPVRSSGALAGVSLLSLIAARLFG